LEAPGRARGDLGNGNRLRPSDLAVAFIVDRGDLEGGELGGARVAEVGIDDDAVADAFAGDVEPDELGRLGILDEEGAEEGKGLDHSIPLQPVPVTLCRPGPSCQRKVCIRPYILRLRRN